MLRRVARITLWGVAAAHLLDALAQRRRWQSTIELPAQPGTDSREEAAGKVGKESGSPRVLAAAGSRIDDEVLAAAADEMVATGADAVDLVPGDIATERALRALRRIDPARLGDDPLYFPGGAHETLVLRPSLADRMGEPGSRSIDRGSLVRRTLAAQRYAPGSTVLRLAPDSRAAPSSPRDRWRELEEVTAFTRPQARLAPILVGGEALHLLTMTVGPLVTPVPGLAALVAWSMKPALVFGGPWNDSVLRLPRAWVENTRTAVEGYRETVSRAARSRAASPPETHPSEEMFEPRRETCPWCGSTALTGRIDAREVLQQKPGTFHLDECVECGHIFQNPRLTTPWLNYHYQDFYEGLGEEMWELVFGAMARLHRNRVQSMARWLPEPRAWLDVGAGHGNFCLVARQHWPDATFDGLDMSNTVSEACRRGWVDRAYLGEFPDLADGLPDSYDVLSMHHYLEHTREPRQELSAAARTLRPGSHLMIEVPDPASPWSHRLGRYWIHWGQPWHQHFVKCENLVAALEEEGFEVLSIERGSTSLNSDLFGAVLLGLQSLSRSPHMPWLPPASLTDRVRRHAVIAAGLPALVAAMVADAVKDSRLGPDDLGNAYRVVARRA